MQLAGSIPRLGFAPLCLQDSPLGVRLSTYSSAFPAGLNAAMTWDRKLMYARGHAMGEEFRGKGVNIALGPVVCAIRLPAVSEECGVLLTEPGRTTGTTPRGRPQLGGLLARSRADRHRHV